MIHSSFQKRDCRPLTKYQAECVLDFLDHPERVLTSGDRVPPNTFYRLLEMYRYEAYYDGPDNPDWHVEIVKALELARISTFGVVIPKAAAIDELEKSLRGIVVVPRECPDRQCDDNARKFFSTFKQVLRLE